jgi:ubiquinone/menaquinone biosynthesis C-methylase UbiE
MENQGANMGENKRAHLQDVFANGASYEPYVGRWSRVVAPEFLSWLDVPAQSRWLDVGCGTGALTQTILASAEPAAVTGVDRSDGFVTFARQQVSDTRVHFEVGDAQQLPVDSGVHDAVVSGLMLNFVPQPYLAVTEMARTARTGGTVALYVWDYAEKMEFMRYFWDAATALFPAALELDEATRFPICNPDALAEQFQRAGLNEVDTRAIDIATHFRDMDDFWQPFLGGQGSAPTYVASLTEADRERLRDHLHATLPVAADGSIPLMARAWAVRGVR